MQRNGFPGQQVEVIVGRLGIQVSKRHGHVARECVRRDAHCISGSICSNLRGEMSDRKMDLKRSRKVKEIACYLLLTVIHFYDGKQRYDLDFTYKGPAPAEERERRLGLTDTIRCSLVYREVAGFKRKPPEQRSQGLRRDVTIGLGRLGPGGPWVVSLLRADTFLGAAEINLVNLRVAHEAPE